MEATKVVDPPIASAAEYHETLVDAFSIAAETANWLTQFNCGWADANAETVGRLTRLVPMVARLTRASRYLRFFAEARITTKADSEAAKFQGPDGEWYASYHDAALGLIVGLLNYATLPHYNEAGQAKSYLVTSDPMNASQNDRVRGREWFDQVKGEYLVGMASEAAAAASASEPAGESERAGDGSDAGDDPSIPPQGFTPGALAESLGVNDRTIGRYARAAGVETPESGEKAKPYPLCDVQRILLRIISRSRRDSTKAADLLHRVNKAMAQRSPTKA